MSEPAANEPQPQYKLILLKTIPGKCDNDSLKIAVFNVPEIKDDILNETDDKDNSDAIDYLHALTKETLTFDAELTKDKLIKENCLSTKLYDLLDDAKITDINALRNEFGMEPRSGGSNKQSTHKRKNRRHRRSQKK